MNATAQATAPTEPTTAEKPASDAAAQDLAPTAAWLDALLAVSRHYRIESSPERAKVEADWLAQDLPLDGMVDHLARQLGLAVVFDRFRPSMLHPWRLPVIADFGDPLVGVIEKVGPDGEVSVRFSGEKGLLTTLSAEALAKRVRRVLLVKPLASVPDARVDDYIRPYKANWFWQMALREWPRYGDVMAASLVANLLAMGSMLFSMQIYDRVIPAQSEHTLWVLFGGLMLAVLFGFAMRMARTHISDLVGKRADLRISDRVFGHALRIRNDVRPSSTGSFISQIRELEQVRELITSTTVTAAVDMPFFLLFAVMMWTLGGPLVWVPLAAVPLLVLPGLLLQRPLARLSREGMRESSLRNAMLVETVQGMDDIKLLRAEPRFQGQWNHVNEVSGGADPGLRRCAGAGRLPGEGRQHEHRGADRLLHHVLAHDLAAVAAVGGDDTLATGQGGAQRTGRADEKAGRPARAQPAGAPPAPQGRLRDQERELPLQPAGAQRDPRHRPAAHSGG